MCARACVCVCACVKGMYLKVVQLFCDLFPCLAHKQLLTLKHWCIPLLKTEQIAAGNGKHGHSRDCSSGVRTEVGHWLLRDDDCFAYLTAVNSPKSQLRSLYSSG